MPIINDAIMATGPIAGGQMVPVLILDFSNHPDADEVLRLHKHLAVGHARTVWGTRSRRTTEVMLGFTFTKPAVAEFCVAFDAGRHGGLIDRIVRTKAVYLQSGRPGDRLITTRDATRVLVEVAASGFEDIWEEIRREALVTEFRSRGFSRKEAREAAEMAIQEWSKLFDLQMPDGP